MKRKPKLNILKVTAETDQVETRFTVEFDREPTPDELATVQVYVQDYKANRPGTVYGRSKPELVEGLRYTWSCMATVY